MSTKPFGDEDESSESPPQITAPTPPPQCHVTHTQYQCLHEPKRCFIDNEQCAEHIGKPQLCPPQLRIEELKIAKTDCSMCTKEVPDICRVYNLVEEPITVDFFPRKNSWRTVQCKRHAGKLDGNKKCVVCEDSLRHVVGKETCAFCHSQKELVRFRDKGCESNVVDWAGGIREGTPAGRHSTSSMPSVDEELMGQLEDP